MSDRLSLLSTTASTRRLGRDACVPRVYAHRFRHTFATWAIAHDAREIDVQHLLGHGCPDMVRRYSATYGTAQVAVRHAAFSPGTGSSSRQAESRLPTTRYGGARGTVQSMASATAIQ